MAGMQLIIDMEVLYLMYITAIFSVIRLIRLNLHDHGLDSLKPSVFLASAMAATHPSFIALPLLCLWLPLLTFVFRCGDYACLQDGKCIYQF